MPTPIEELRRIPRRSTPPRRDLDLVAVRIVEIERFHRHKRMLTTTQCETESGQPGPLPFVFVARYSKANVVNPPAGGRRQVGRSRHQHNLLRDALRWGDRKSVV